MALMSRDTPIAVFLLLVAMVSLLFEATVALELVWAIVVAKFTTVLCVVCEVLVPLMVE